MLGSHYTPTGYGPRARLYFDGRTESFPMWETSFTSYSYTLDKAVHEAILPRQEGVDEDADYDAKNRWAYTELVQVLDERSLQIIMSDSPNNGRNLLKTLQQHYASTEKSQVLKLYEELTTIRMTLDEDATDYLIRAKRAATGLNAAGEKITDNLTRDGVSVSSSWSPDGLKTYQRLVSVSSQTKPLRSRSHLGLGTQGLGLVSAI
jgi:hypothetical protein